MTVNYLEYPLADGYIHNWLVAGPRKTAAVSLPQYLADADGFVHVPVDGDVIAPGDEALRWQYYRCQCDHWVNLPFSCATPLVVDCLGYVQLTSPAEQQATFVLMATTPVKVWINGQAAHFTADASSATAAVSFSAALREGKNELVVCAATANAGIGAIQFALRLAQLTAPELVIEIPTHAEQPKRQQRLEHLLDYAYLEDAVNHRGAHFNLRWADDLEEDLVYAYQVQDANEAIYVDGKGDTEKSRVIDIGQEYRLYERPYRVVLKATDVEHYGQNLRYQRAMPIHVLDTAFSASPYGTFNERHQEALVDAAKHDDQLYAQIARMQLSQWDQVDSKVILAAVERVNGAEYGRQIDLLGLLGMVNLFGGNPGFPADILQVVENCALKAIYLAETNDESAQLINLTCELLAGQRYPTAVFVVSGKTGAWHKTQAEQAAQAWLQLRGQVGYAAWDSNIEFAWIIAALAHLTTLAENDVVVQFSLALLDKTLFSMAINSFKGAYGSSHGKTNANMLKSAQLEATSGIMSMMWGTGVFNHHIVGTVSLACSKYEFPLFIGEIANDLTGEMLSRERHQLAQGEVNKLTYRTPDYLLASALDYHPGQPGSSEHIWQATFGPDALVFVTHPACISEHEANQPGFWLGNAVLPRVAQWKDVLVSVHQLPEDDRMGFTHAYFPIYSFEEYGLDDRWAFARMGDGYLALTAANGLEWIKHAPDGYRELRSYGQQNIWLCHMGRAAQDGSFSEFQEKIRAMKLEWGKLSTACVTLRGDQVAFGWQGPLTVNGQEQPLGGFKHFENPYGSAEFPAKSMEISFQGTAMRLSFD